MLLPLLLAGCGTAGSIFTSNSPATVTGPNLGASPFTRARPVPPPAAATLETSPGGSRLAYGSMTFTLGPVYQSGLQASCRIGRLNGGGGRGDAPTAYAFCRDGNQWYEMPPVVVSGY